MIDHYQHFSAARGTAAAGGGGKKSELATGDIDIGIWRANHKTLGAWTERAYPEEQQQLKLPRQ